MKIVQWNKHFDFVMIALKFMMWPIGNWPLQDYNLFASIRTTIALILTLPMLVLLCVEISLSRNSADLTVDIIMIIFCTILTISKTCFYRIHAVDLVYSFESALKDHEVTIFEEERAIMRHHGLMGKAIVLGSIFFVSFDMLVLTLVPILAEDTTVKDATQNQTKQYPIPIGYTMMLLKLPDNLYVLMFLVTCSTLLVMSCGNIGSDCLFFAITMHLCGQAEVLKFRFANFVETDDTKLEHFKTLTRRHQYLIDMSTRLARAISSILFVQLTLSSLLICVVGLQLILALKFKDIVIITRSVVVLSTFLVQLFSYSYVGDYLKCQMEDVAHSAFSCGWVKFPKSLTRDLAFVIMRAQRPLHLKAGKFFVVTIETYMGILKTSMSYLSVLRVMVNG